MFIIYIPYLQVEGCKCIGWKKEEGCDAESNEIICKHCNHDLKNHGGVIKMSTTELDTLVRMVIDMEHLLTMAFNETDSDTKQIFFYLAKVF